jgi:hypothetical protein
VRVHSSPVMLSLSAACDDSSPTTGNPVVVIGDKLDSTGSTPNPRFSLKDSFLPLVAVLSVKIAGGHHAVLL